VPQKRPNAPPRSRASFVVPSRRVVLAALIVGLVAGAVLTFVLLAQVLRFDSQAVETGVILAATIVTALATGVLAWFGWVQFVVDRHTRERTERTATLRARAIARLARRSLVEMINQVQGILMVAWIAAIGASKALDPIQAFLRDLIDETAPLGGDMATAAERALTAFLFAADRINGLRANLPATGDFGGKELAEQGQILGFLIAAVEALRVIAPSLPDERAVKPEVQAMAESIERFFGPLLEDL